MFTECEQWRKEQNIDDIVETFTFDENPLVTAYYPRYYHKTDKVYSSLKWVLMIGWSTRVY